MPRKLKRLFAGDIEVVTVQERGWDSLENGDLLEAARGEFDALLTTDRGIPHQQDLSGLALMVVVLEARSNRLEDLSPLVEEVEAVLRRTSRGDQRGSGEAHGVWRVTEPGEAPGEAREGRGTRR